MSSYEPSEVEKILITEKEIEEKVTMLAEQINKMYAGKEVILVGVLKGAVFFFVDLCKRLHLDVQVELISASSYGDSTTSSGSVNITLDVKQSLEGKHVIIVEDICDTGLTLHHLTKLFETRKVASLKTCVLLRKAARLKVPNIQLDFIGFDIEDHFVIGYGLDYAGRFRQLPYIGILKESIYKS